MLTLGRINHKATLTENTVVLKMEGQGVADSLHLGEGQRVELPQNISNKQTKQITVVQVGLVLRWGGYDSGLR